jgi:lipid A ethanolaminephosphotransferase
VPINFTKTITTSSKLSLNVNTVIVLVSLYFAIVLNHPVIDKFYVVSGYNLQMFFTTHLLLTAAFIIIFSLIAWPYLFKILLIPLILTSALTFYASVKYNVMFDYSMIENIFETHTSEATSYLNLTAIIYFIGFGLIPALLLLKVKVRYNNGVLKTLFLRAALICSMIAVIGLIAAVYYKDYSSIGRNNNYLNKMINPAHAFNTYKYVKKTYFTTPLEYKKLGEDATLPNASNGKPTLMIFAIGETARSQNIAYNGYARNTNPHTQNKGIISFQNVSSCGTATAVSLPCMFSNMSHTTYQKERAIKQDNVLDVLNHAGVKVHWLENDGGDKQVAQNLIKTVIEKSSNSQLCSSSSCFDEVMLLDLPKLIEQQAGSDQLLALHLIGSHGPTYYQRYPAEHALFSPACERSDIEKCSDQQIVNVYDNTIAYTDYVLSQAITLLEQYQDRYNVALFYLSDHGESLGENGLYLHGTPYVVAPAEQTQVPWYMWASDDYFRGRGIDKACLQNSAMHDSISHDNLFHTLLGFYGVETQEKQQALDITANCKF